jgi:hypothetical protein
MSYQCGSVVQLLYAYGVQLYSVLRTFHLSSPTPHTYSASSQLPIYDLPSFQLKNNMPPKQAEKKTMVKNDKLTQGEKKKLKNENKAKANPDKAAAKKLKNDATRQRRYVFVPVHLDRSIFHFGESSSKRDIPIICDASFSFSLSLFLVAHFHLTYFKCALCRYRTETGSVKKLG